MELVKIEEDAVAFNVSVECIRIKEEEEQESSSACAAEEEAGGQTECGVSAAAARAGLYAGHDVKGELVLGPTELQPSWHTDITQEGTKNVETFNHQFSRSQIENHEAICDSHQRSNSSPITIKTRKLKEIPEKVSISSDVECNTSVQKRSLRHEANHMWRQNYAEIKSLLPVNHTSIHDSGESLPGASCGDQLRLRACSVRLQRLPAAGHASSTIKWNESILSATEAKYTGVSEKQVSDNCDADIKQMLLKIKVDKAPVTPNNDRTEEHNQTRSNINDTECKICFKLLASRRSLYNHLRRHSVGKPFKCADCMKRFACPRDLQRHSTLVHYKENITTRQNFNANSRILAGTKKKEYNNKIYECNFCDKVFYRRIAMITHELHVHFNKKQYKCDICMAEFLYKHSLISHLRIHTGEKPYKCKFCHDQFTQLSTLNYHLKLHQRPHFNKRKQTQSNNKKTYKCEICLKLLSTNKILKRHLTLHTGRKPYKCDFCTKAFSHRIFLKRHRLTHTRVEQFKCVFCSAEFCTKATLKVHLSVGRRSCPESDRLCAVCGAKFERRALLLQHMQAHTLPPEQA